MARIWCTDTVDDGRTRRNVWARQGGQSFERNRLVAASTGSSSYALRTQADGAQRRYPRCSVAVVAVVAALSGTLEQMAIKASFLAGISALHDYHYRLFNTSFQRQSHRFSLLLVYLLCYNPQPICVVAS
jgi:hypothetical protein